MNIRQIIDSQESVLINGKRVPARPINYKYRTLLEKLRDAWAVFTGKSDAVTWPEGQ